MNETIEKISDLIVRSGKKQKNLMEHLNVSPNLFTEWKAGRNKSYKKYLPQIAEYFGVSVDYLLGKEEPQQTEFDSQKAMGVGNDSANASLHQESSKTTSKRAIRIPVYEKLSRNKLIETVTALDFDISNLQKPQPHVSNDISVAVGIPLRSIDNFEDYEEYPTEAAAGAEFVALRLHEDSMAPRMMPGDVVIIKVQKEFNDGDIVVVFVDDLAICRKIKKTPEGVLLLSANPSFEPIFCSNQQLSSRTVRILGIIVELRAKFTSI